MKNILRLTLILIAILLTQCKKDFTTKPSIGQEQKINNTDNIGKYEKGTLLIRWKPSANSSLVSRYSKGAQFIEDKVMKSLKIRGYYKIKVDDEQAAFKELSKSPDVEMVSYQYYYKTQQVSNDPYYVDGRMWGPQAIGANTAWANGNIGDTSIVWAVMDEGIQWDHEDFNNIWINPHEIPKNGIDDDGNGKVDDVYGWDALHNDNTVYDGPDAHAMGVSSIIAGRGFNGIGTIGIAPKCRIMSLKFLESYGTTQDAQELFYLAIWYKQHGINLRGINCSWGGGGPDPFLQEAIYQCKLNDILVICAAGNQGTDNDGDNKFYPASLDNTDTSNIISVAATDINGNLAGFSCFGATTVDMGAPGVSVWEAWAGNCSIPQGTYLNPSGTSMATPHVSGAAILYIAGHPEANYLEVKRALKESAIHHPLTSLAGKTITGGIVNVASFSYVTPDEPERVLTERIVRDCVPPTGPHVDSVRSQIGSMSWGWHNDQDSTLSATYFFISRANGQASDYWTIIFPTYITSYTLVPGDLNGFIQDDTLYRLVGQNVDKWSNWSGNTQEYFFRCIKDSIVQPPPPSLPVITSFTANPSTITIGGSSTLSWSTSNATTLSIDHGVGTVTGTSVNVFPAVTTTYTLTATNSAGSVTAQTIVTVNIVQPPPPNISVTLSGDAATKTLTWSITGATNPVLTLQRKNKAFQNYSDWQTVTGTGYKLPAKPNKPYFYRIKLVEGNATFYSNEIQI